MCGVPLGDTAVCHAGVSLTQPQSNLTVPPMFGSKTWWSSPRSPEISLASSTIATTGAPVRFAMSTVSPMWSACPCVSRMWVGSTSSACLAAFGLPVRNGSMSRRVSPSSMRKQAWPRNVISMSGAPLGSLSHQLVGELEADGDADQHAEPGLLVDERPHGRQPLRRVLDRRRLRQLRLVGGAEPPSLGQRRGEHALQARRRVGDDLL